MRKLMRFDCLKAGRPVRGLRTPTRFTCISIRYQPVDDVIVIPGPDLETVRVAGRDVTDYVHLLAVDLRALQLVHEPLQLADRVGAVDQQPPVLVVAVVHVDREDPEARPHQDRVERAAANRVRDAGRQPASPVLVELVVQPRDAVLLGHEGRREAGTGECES